MTYLQEASRNAITVPKLQAMRDAGERIAMLTCYDASFAALLDRAGVDVLLIGDSLGNVLQGQTTTLPVSLADIAYHTASVARARPAALAGSPDKSSSRPAHAEPAACGRRPNPRSPRTDRSPYSVESVVHLIH